MQGMRKIHLILMDCSTKSMADGVELTVTDSGDIERKGTEKFSESRPPLDAKILQDNL
jgi:hypothetical protein